MAKASCVMTSDEEGLTGSLMLSQVRSLTPAFSLSFRGGGTVCGKSIAICT